MPSEMNYVQGRRPMEEQGESEAHDMRKSLYSPVPGSVSRARSALEGMKNSARRCLSGSWAVRYSAYSLLSWAAVAWPLVVGVDSAIIFVFMLYADGGWVVARSRV